MWKSGEVKSSYLIPWEVQVANTNTSNYLWEKDNSSLMVVQAGLYEVQFGFYTDRKPSIQMFVNGDIVLSASGLNQYT